MSDLIDREKAIKALKRQLSDWNPNYNVPVCDCIQVIENMPSVDPVKKGKWIYFAEAGGFKSNFYKCSECGKAYWMIDNKKDSFCRRCGARMG